RLGRTVRQGSIPLTRLTPSEVRLPPVSVAARPLVTSPLVSGPSRDNQVGPGPASGRLRSAERLEATRQELARLQDSLAQDSLASDEQDRMIGRTAEVAASLGDISYLRGKLVQILLG
ncbi:MAG: hypothetical protein RBU30_03140, partial [Polyangia bacterium]|nr:hypothetical protein [Polyangia bacterium]